MCETIGSSSKGTSLDSAVEAIWRPCEGFSTCQLPLPASLCAYITLWPYYIQRMRRQKNLHGIPPPVKTRGPSSEDHGHSHKRQRNLGRWSHHPESYIQTPWFAAIVSRSDEDLWPWTGNVTRFHIYIEGILHLPWVPLYPADRKHFYFS